MRWKQSVLGAVLLLGGSMATASFFSDLIESVVVSISEQQNIAKAPDSKWSAEEALRQSIGRLNDGQQTEAERLINSALKTHREDIRILFAKGVLRRSRWRKLTSDVWFVACMAKGNETLARAAWLSTQLDRHRDVKKNLNELIRLSDENPDDIYLLWLGAIQCREQSRSSSRLSHTEKARVAQLGKARYRMLLSHFELGPVMVHHTYANILTEDTGDYDEALEHRIIALSMAPRNWTLEGFADTLTRMKKFHWACTVWAQAIRYNPSDARCFNRWGDALNALKNYSEAEEKYREAVRLKSRNGMYWNDLADVLNNQKKYKEAFKSYQEAVDLGREWATGGLAYCYHYGRGTEKDGKKAFKFYRRRQKVSENDIWLNQNLGIFYDTGIGTEPNISKAIECYDRVKKERPKLYSRLGWLYAFGPDEKIKNPRKAKDNFEEALVHFPSNTVALCNFSDFLSNDNTPPIYQNFPRSVQLARRALDQVETKEFLATMAQAYFKNGQYEEAVKTQQRTIEFLTEKPSNTPIPKEVEDALGKYKKALKKEKDNEI